MLVVGEEERRPWSLRGERELEPEEALGGVGLALELSLR
jgi:hypothetical protein